MIAVEVHDATNGRVSKIDVRRAGAHHERVGVPFEAAALILFHIRMRLEIHAL